MSRKPGKVPSYGHHKASGCAVVRLDGKDHYLGACGTPESHEEYERLIAEWRVRREEVKQTSLASSNGSAEQGEVLDETQARISKLRAIFDRGQQEMEKTIAKINRRRKTA
jgi:hypothetical protein